MMPSIHYCPWCGSANQSAFPRCLACGLFLQGDSSPSWDDQKPLYRVSRWLKQRYLIMRCIGTGGMGVVYEAVDGVLHRRVAVKKMRPINTFPYQEIDAVNTFQREAVLLAQLDHAHLPQVYDYLSERGFCYLVMELVAGMTLEAYLDIVPGKRLPINDILALGIHLCSVLDYLHTRPSPIIFRDLKPSNIMITMRGKLYLIDFGIARYFKPGSQKDTLQLGTTGYAAPEQFGWAQTTPRSDIYSLGALLHRLVTGDDPSIRPFQFAPLHTGKYVIPTDLAQLIMSMIDLNEDKRPGSAVIVMKVLQDIANAVEVHPISWTVRSTSISY
jgi:serine/threonine protein kinase